MPYSPNLGIIHLDPAQSNKAATVNEQLDAVDVAIAGAVSVSVAGGSNVTLTTTPDGGQAENAIIILTGLLTANIDVIFPNITREWHVVNNTTGAYSVTCIGTSGTGVAVAQSTECDIRWDATSGNMLQSSSTVAGGGGSVTLAGDATGASGSNQVVSTHLSSPLPVAQGGTGDATLTAHGVLVGEGTSAVAAVTATDAQLLLGQTSADPAFKTMSGDASITDAGVVTVSQYKGAALPADVGIDFGVGVLTASQTIGFHAVRAHNFAANFASSQGVAKVASTGTAVITVYKNGTSIGTITYTSSATPAFATSGGSAESLAAGDLLEFVAPSSPDATLAGVRITLFGTR